MSHSPTSAPGAVTGSHDSDRSLLNEQLQANARLGTALQEASLQLRTNAELLRPLSEKVIRIDTVTDAQKQRIQDLHDALSTRLPDLLQVVLGSVNNLRSAAPLRHKAILTAVSETLKAVEKTQQQTERLVHEFQEKVSGADAEASRVAREHHREQKELLEQLRNSLEVLLTGALVQTRLAISDLSNAVGQLRSEQREAWGQASSSLATELRHAIEQVASDQGQEIDKAGNLLATRISERVGEQLSTVQTEIVAQLRDVIVAKLGQSSRRTGRELDKLRQLVSQADEKLARAERELLKQPVDDGNRPPSGVETKTTVGSAKMDASAQTDLANAKKDVAEAKSILSSFSLDILGAGKLSWSGRERITLIALAMLLFGVLVWIYAQLRISVNLTDREHSAAELNRMRDNLQQQSAKYQTAAAKVSDLELKLVKLQCEYESKTKEVGDLNTKLKEQKICRTSVRTAATGIAVIQPSHSLLAIPCTPGTECRAGNFRETLCRNN